MVRDSHPLIYYLSYPLSKNTEDLDSGDVKRLINSLDNICEGLGGFRLDEVVPNSRRDYDKIRSTFNTISEYLINGIFVRNYFIHSREQPADLDETLYTDKWLSKGDRRIRITEIKTEVVHLYKRDTEDHLFTKQLRLLEDSLEGFYGKPLSYKPSTVPIKLE